MNPVCRRRFLMSATFIGGAGLALFAARRAFAFSLEQGSAETQALYFGHFSDINRYHTELVAELTAKLPGHTQAEIEAALATACCPICDAPLA